MLTKELPNQLKWSVSDILSLHYLRRTGISGDINVHFYRNRNMIIFSAIFLILLRF